MQLLHELRHFDEIDVVLILAVLWWISKNTKQKNQNE